MNIDHMYLSWTDDDFAKCVSVTLISACYLLPSGCKGGVRCLTDESRMSNGSTRVCSSSSVQPATCWKSLDGEASLLSHIQMSMK